LVGFHNGLKIRTPAGAKYGKLHQKTPKQIPGFSQGEQFGSNYLTYDRIIIYWSALQDFQRRYFSNSIYGSIVSSDSIFSSKVFSDKVSSDYISSSEVL
jgi:hypothetical protein